MQVKLRIYAGGITPGITGKNAKERTKKNSTYKSYRY
jgi:hypothetical protein